METTSFLSLHVYSLPIPMSLRTWKRTFVGLNPLCLLQIIVICAVVSVHTEKTEDLYTDADHIVNIDKETLTSKFFGKQNIFIVEFYNSWCGYCRGFAPTWKAFAQDVRSWGRVAQVGAVNCAQLYNDVVCRDYEVDHYPTIKTFGINAQKGDLGQLFNHTTDITKMRYNLIDRIDHQWRKLVPTHWPNLEPIWAEDVQGIWKYVPSSRNNVTLIVEQEGSYIGREVILDMSSYEVSVLRILSSNSKLIQNLLNEVTFSTLPVLLFLRRPFGLKLLSGPSVSPRNDFHNIIEQQILHEDFSVTTLPSITTTKTTTMSGSFTPVVLDYVDGADLSNSLFYTLRQEIPRGKEIEGDHLDALKSFLKILSYYYPEDPATNSFLRDLYLRVVKIRSSKITANAFVDMMNTLERGDRKLRQMTKYVGCLGSTPVYRKYPCGLWSLFHTLTVQAYQQYLQKKHDDITLPQGVLIPIRDHVLSFFSCAECAKNFKTESARVNEEIRFPQDTVLWLWKTHNLVNKRLAGDPSEDPYFPKVQYPLVAVCPVCHLRGSTNENPRWNETAVLEFLMKHYTNIRFTDTQSIYHTTDSPFLGYPWL